MVPDGFINEELLKLKQGHIAEEKETAEKERKKCSRKFTMKGLTKTSAGLNKFLKMFEYMDTNQKVFSNKEKVHCALSAYKHVYMTKKEINQANHHRPVSEE